MPKIHFGVTIPQIKRTWAEAKSNSIEFEAMGYDSLWVGDRISLPLRVEHRPPSGDLIFLCQVRDLDVWDPAWTGHPVYLDDDLVAHLKPPFSIPGDIPPEGAIGELRPPQVALLRVPRQTLGERTRFRLSIVLDRQPGHERLMDDFVLQRIESIDWVIRVGW